MKNSIQKEIKSTYPSNPIIEALTTWAFDYDETQDLREVVENMLDMCSCSGCHAPAGLIYNQEVAEKVPLWWDAINDALHDYHDQTGDHFNAETIVQLVWFSVEFYAGELSGFIQSTDEWEKMEALENDPSTEDLHARFDAEILPHVKEQYEQDGIPDVPARSEAFNDWTDALCKDGEISDQLYSSIDHPSSCN